MVAEAIPTPYGEAISHPPSLAPVREDYYYYYFGFILEPALRSAFT